MAINVSNWSEFVSAVGVSGANVILPEGETWDMNEILPHFNQSMTIACASIDGQGTEIKNLHITGHFLFTSATQVSNLAITNILGDGTGGGGTYQRGVFYSTANANPAMTSCTYSGIFGTGYARLCNCSTSNKKFDLVQCAFHMDMESGWDLGAYNANACRFFMNFPTASTIYASVGTNDYCEYVINAPLATICRFQTIGSSTLRGNMQNVTDLQASGGREMNVYNLSSLPNASVSGTSTKITGVTDEQMKDAAYLRSIGFLIGSD